MQLTIAITPEAKKFLVSEGATPGTGARGLRRVLEDHLQDQIADLILDGKLQLGGTVEVTAGSDGKLRLEVNEESPVKQGTAE